MSRPDDPVGREQNRPDQQPSQAVPSQEQRIEHANREDPLPETPPVATGLVECYRATEPMWALLLAARLSDQGNRAEVDLDITPGTGGARPGYRVLVRDEDLPRARA